MLEVMHNKITEKYKRLATTGSILYTHIIVKDQVSMRGES